MKKKTIDNIKTWFMIIAIVVFLIFFFKACDNDLKKNGSFIEQVGKSVKELQEEFNKGYLNDSL